MLALEQIQKQNEQDTFGSERTITMKVGWNYWFHFTEEWIADETWVKVRCSLWLKRRSGEEIPLVRGGYLYGYGDDYFDRVTDEVQAVSNAVYRELDTDGADYRITESETVIKGLSVNDGIVRDYASELGAINRVTVSLPAGW